MAQKSETKEERKQAEKLYQKLLDKYPHEADFIKARWENEPTLRAMQDEQAALDLFG